MNELAPQIPFELFEAEAPSFENFLVGRNEEAVTQLYAAANDQQASSIVFWGSVGCGKSHLLDSAANVAIARGRRAIRLNAVSEIADSPFDEFSVVVADDVHLFDAVRQAWLFNAFNHLIGRGGQVFAAGGTRAPTQWPIREDLRSRLASGLVFELLPPPDDALPTLLREFSSKRGVSIGDDALAYLLTHTDRDVGNLCQTLVALDQLSLSLKRPISVHLIRAFLAQRPRG